MRYDNGKDWVEIKGVADKPMRELATLEDPDMTPSHAFAVAVTVDAHFTDRDGNVIDWRKDVLALTVQQWQWWKLRIWAAAREEKLDPEA
jgi:exosome complex RNA-binding protein Rrp42 (RNase PH superfamily)